MKNNPRKSPMMRLFITVILTIFLCSAALSLASSQFNVKLIPVDEAQDNPEFQEFHQQLLTAIEKRDVEFLLAHIDLEIKYGYGYSGGLEGFVKHWHLHENPEKSKLWAELTEVLVLGGVFQDGTFVAPYLFARFPDYDKAYDHSVVIGQNVNLRAQPSLNAKVVAKTSFEIVQLLKWDIMRYGKTARESSWVKVRTAAGAIGYISALYLRSPFDYRAGFAKCNGMWKMIYFVNGDKI